MATQPLPLLMPEHARVFRAFVAWLRSDGDLRRVVRSWRAWDGSADVMLADAVTMLPLVRITPEMGPRERVAILGDGTHAYSAPMTIHLETEAAGTAAEESMKLWDALDARIMAWQPGITVPDFYVTQPAQVTNDADVTTAKGSVALEMYVNR